MTNWTPSLARPVFGREDRSLNHADESGAFNLRNVVRNLILREDIDLMTKRELVDEIITRADQRTDESGASIWGTVLKGVGSLLFNRDLETRLLNFPRYCSISTYSHNLVLTIFHP